MRSIAFCFLNHQRSSRRGSIIVPMAICMVMLLGMAALAIDLGYVCSVRDDIQRSVDAGALAGAGELIKGPDVAIAQATTFTQLNVVGRKTLATDEVQVEVGRWNRNTRTFAPNLAPFDAVRVIADRKNSPLFFAKALGSNSFNMRAHAVATAQPRDIMLVLDYSGSMNEWGKIQALKDAVQMFLNYLQQVPGQDRVGFTVYSTQASLAQTLTFDLNTVNQHIQQRSASGWTNIGQGLEIGRTDLENNGRAMAKKMIVLMTDGMANRPEGRDPFQYVIDEANLCDQAQIPVVAISFGVDADQSIMRRVAEITGSIHFHVAGSVADQEEQLKKVFLEVAANRPLKLVD